MIGLIEIALIVLAAAAWVLYWTVIAEPLTDREQLSDCHKHWPVGPSR